YIPTKSGCKFVTDSLLALQIVSNPESALSCILALSYKSHQSWQYFVMHCSLRSKSHQSRQRFVMHLSSALQIGPILAVLCHALQLALQIASILAVLCHALQLALQITPISTALCHASYLCVTNRTNLGSVLSCTLALHDDELLFTMTIGDILQEFQHNRSNSKCPLSI